MISTLIRWKGRWWEVKSLKSQNRMARFSHQGGFLIDIECQLGIILTSWSHLDASISHPQLQILRDGVFHALRKFQGEIINFPQKTLVCSQMFVKRWKIIKNRHRRWKFAAECGAFLQRQVLKHHHFEKTKWKDFFFKLKTSIPLIWAKLF